MSQTLSLRPAAAPVQARQESPFLRDLLTRRHSCRGFKDTRVDRDVIVSIIEMAMRTPSWCNAQPWMLKIVSGNAADAFREAYVQVAASTNPCPDFDFPTAYVGRYLDRRRECGWRLYESVGIAKGDRKASASYALENYRFFGAPHVAIVTSDASLGPYGAIDCGGFVSNFVLAAEANGVATLPQAALATHPDFVRSFLGLDASRKVVCGIAFGYEDTSHPANKVRMDRAPVDEVVSWLD